MSEKLPETWTELLAFHKAGKITDNILSVLVKKPGFEGCVVYSLGGTIDIQAPLDSYAFAKRHAPELFEMIREAGLDGNTHQMQD